MRNFCSNFCFRDLLAAWHLNGAMQLSACTALLAAWHLNGTELIHLNGPSSSCIAKLAHKSFVNFACATTAIARPGRRHAAASGAMQIRSESSSPASSCCRRSRYVVLLPLQRRDAVDFHIHQMRQMRRDRMQVLRA